MFTQIRIQIANKIVRFFLYVYLYIENIWKILILFPFFHSCLNIHFPFFFYFKLYLLFLFYTLVYIFYISIITYSLFNETIRYNNKSSGIVF